MNVKLTLTVPVEEVQIEVNKILEDCEKRINLICQDIHYAEMENTNPIQQMEMIHEIRKKMTILDLKLEDSYSILSGLVRFKASKDMSHGATNQKGQSDKDTAE